MDCVLRAVASGALSTDQARDLCVIIEARRASRGTSCGFR
jgi:hypothetical protein